MAVGSHSSRIGMYMGLTSGLALLLIRDDAEHIARIGHHSSQRYGSPSLHPISSAHAEAIE